MKLKKGKNFLKINYIFLILFYIITFLYYTMGRYYVLAYSVLGVPASARGNTLYHKLDALYYESAAGLSFIVSILVLLVITLEIVFAYKKKVGKMTYYLGATILAPPAFYIIETLFSAWFCGDRWAGTCIVSQILGILALAFCIVHGITTSVYLVKDANNVMKD